MTHKVLPEFDVGDCELLLRSWPNGGWTIERRASGHGVMPTSLGAFSCSVDMIEALHLKLLPSTKKVGTN